MHGVTNALCLLPSMSQECHPDSGLCGPLGKHFRADSVLSPWQPPFVFLCCLIPSKVHSP